MSKNKYRLPFIVLTSLFFIWGFLTVVVDGFIPRLKDVFELSYAKAGLIQVAWFIAYFIISIPGGALVARVGYKRGIIGALLICGLGCLLFLPAASSRIFGLFLLALFVLASGITILQVAANPYVSVLGPEEKASSRLNLAQAFNSLGTTLAPIFSATVLLSESIKTSAQINQLAPAAKDAYYTSEAHAVETPFLIIAGILFLIAVLFAVFKLPKILEDGPSGNLAKALRIPKLRMGMLGIFVYVGAEVAIGSYIINYFISMHLQDPIVANEVTRSIAAFVAKVFNGTDIHSIDPKAIVGTFVIFYWGGAMIGRFVGSYLTSRWRPAHILITFALCNIVLLFITMLSTGFITMFALLAVGLFNSIMFPTIFTLSIEGLGEQKPQGSGLLCTAIVGGAVIPPLFGILIDNIGFKLAFFLPLICYAYIAVFGRYILKKVPLELVRQREQAESA